MGILIMHNQTIDMPVVMHHLDIDGPILMNDQDIDGPILMRNLCAHAKVHASILAAVTRVALALGGVQILPINIHHLHGVPSLHFLFLFETTEPH